VGRGGGKNRSVPRFVVFTCITVVLNTGKGKKENREGPAWQPIFRQPRPAASWLPWDSFHKWGGGEGDSPGAGAPAICPTS